jgi:hypothetical protein
MADKKETEFKGVCEHSFSPQQIIAKRACKGQFNLSVE